LPYSFFLILHHRRLGLARRPHLRKSSPERLTPWTPTTASRVLKSTMIAIPRRFFSLPRPSKNATLENRGGGLLGFLFSNEHQGCEVPSAFFFGRLPLGTKVYRTPLQRNWRSDTRPSDQATTARRQFTGNREGVYRAHSRPNRDRQNSVQSADSKSLATGEMWLNKTLG
jgi:hypothetical protein